jgi:hypothetical protein
MAMSDRRDLEITFRKADEEAFAEMQGEHSGLLETLGQAVDFRFSAVLT